MKYESAKNNTISASSANIVPFNESSILCNEKDFPTYPPPLNERRLNWSFLSNGNDNNQVRRVHRVQS